MTKLTDAWKQAQMRDNALDITTGRKPETPVPDRRHNPPAPALDIANQVHADHAAARTKELNAKTQPPAQPASPEQVTRKQPPSAKQQAFAKAAATTPTKQAFYRAARVQRPKSR